MNIRKRITTIGGSFIAAGLVTATVAMFVGSANKIEENIALKAKVFKAAAEITRHATSYEAAVQKLKAIDTKKRLFHPNGSLAYCAPLAEGSRVVLNEDEVRYPIDLKKLSNCYSASAERDNARRPSNIAIIAGSTATAYVVGALGLFYCLMCRRSPKP